MSDNLRDDSIKDLSYEQFDNALRRLASSNVEGVHFLGGEPTIRKDFLDLLRIGNECGLTVSFNTNGIRQDKRYLDGIFAYNIHKVVVSIDGPDERSHEAIRGANTFHKTVAFVRQLIALRRERGQECPYVQIQSVLTGTWAHRVHDMVSLCVELGVDGLKVNHLAEFGDASSHLHSLFPGYSAHFFALLDILDCSIKHPNLRIEAPIKALVYQYHRRHSEVKLAPDFYNCPAIHDNIYVGPNGDVAPCQLAHLQGMGNDLPIGNIVSDEPAALWNSEYFDLFYREVQDTDFDALYRNQIPCNRCAFRGIVCNPCPLPSKPGFYPTNYMCLIAEQLLNVEDETAQQLSRVRAEQEITRIVADNPLRSSHRHVIKKMGWTPPSPPRG